MSKIDELENLRDRIENRRVVVSSIRATAKRENRSLTPQERETIQAYTEDQQRMHRHSVVIERMLG